MSVDVISDFLTIIRNGLMRSQPTVIAPYSKIKHSIANILKQEGFIKDAVLEEKDAKKALKVYLKYVDGESVIHQINRVSTVSRRKYSRSNSLQPVIGNLGISILTTNKGIITDKQAKELGVGGEVICSVW